MPGAMPGTMTCPAYSQVAQVSLGGHHLIHEPQTIAVGLQHPLGVLRTLRGDDSRRYRICFNLIGVARVTTRVLLAKRKNKHGEGC